MRFHRAGPNKRLEVPRALRRSLHRYRILLRFSLVSPNLQKQSPIHFSAVWIPRVYTICGGKRLLVSICVMFFGRQTPKNSAFAGSMNVSTNTGYRPESSGPNLPMERWILALRHVPRHLMGEMRRSPFSSLVSPLNR
jgi:hypothetical protein